MSERVLQKVAKLANGRTWFVVAHNGRTWVIAINDSLTGIWVVR